MKALPCFFAITRVHFEGNGCTLLRWLNRSRKRQGLANPVNTEVRPTENLMIWRGKGWLVPAIVFVVSLIAELLTEDVIFKDDTYYQGERWPFACSLVVSAATLWRLGRKVFPTTTRRLTDQDSGQEVVFKDSHDFLFVRMEYWGPLLLLSSIGYLLFG